MKLVSACVGRINPNGTRKIIYKTSAEDEARLRAMADESSSYGEKVIDLQLNPKTGVYERIERK